MKIILSRKGFDSSSGGIPSPILPDGTLLSLPIPNDVNRYEDLEYKGKNYFEIIYELSNGKIRNKECHYDPDIRENAIKANLRPKNWRAAFGQVGASLTHLQNYEIQKGDLFLFFGLFRECEIKNGKYQFIRGTKPKHIIWGYLQIDEILQNPTEKEFPWLVEKGKNKHPHIDRENKNNAIFIGAKTLSWDKSMKGADCLEFNHMRVLTREGMSTSRWELPDFFKEIDISHHKRSDWKDNYFQSTGRGQEFVFSTENRLDVMNWVSDLIGAERIHDKRGQISSDNITSLMYDEIFVFGSNKEGNHAGGAAKQALKWGAIQGQGEGIQGKTYAIPTMFDSVEEIKPYVDRFIEYAKANPYKRFLVTSIGCGIANFTPDQIAPLFIEVVRQSITNICLPEEFAIINISFEAYGKD
ncbi:MAG: hypothetical protein M9897_11345 [Brumimicrobium sp.]|nr:hypothetical protein [Brumimicrobium sp.]